MGARLGRVEYGGGVDARGRQGGAGCSSPGSLAWVLRLRDYGRGDGSHGRPSWMWSDRIRLSLRIGDGLRQAKSTRWRGHQSGHDPRVTRGAQRLRDRRQRAAHALLRSGGVAVTPRRFVGGRSALRGCPPSTMARRGLRGDQARQRRRLHGGGNVGPGREQALRRCSIRSIASGLVRRARNRCVSRC